MVEVVTEVVVRKERMIVVPLAVAIVITATVVAEIVAGVCLEVLNLST